MKTIKSPQGFIFLPELILLVLVVTAVAGVSYLAAKRHNSPPTKTGVATNQPSISPQITSQPSSASSSTKPASTDSTSTATYSTPATSNTPVAPGGINGKVLYHTNRGANCPECPPTQDQPYQATIQIKTQDGASVVKTISSDSNGVFSVSLPPGTYLLVPEPESNGYSTSQDQSTTVKSGVYNSVVFYYSSPVA